MDLFVEAADDDALESSSDGFYGYVETSHDPGYSLIFATILFCIISYCSLPFLVALGDRLDVKNQRPSTNKQKQRRKKRDNYDADEDNDVYNDQQEEADSNNNNASFDHGAAADPNCDTPEHPHYCTSAADMSVVSVEPSISSRSMLSLAPSVSSIGSLHSHRTNRRHRKRHKRQMEKRHGKEELALRMQKYDAYVEDMGVGDIMDGPMANNDSTCNDSPTTKSRSRHPSSPPSCRESSPERSIMGPLDQDAVSMDDAVSNAAGSPTQKGIPPHFHAMMNAQHNIDGDHHPDNINMVEDTGIWNTLLDLVQWDFESKRIVKLAIPFATQALSTGILDSITVAVIGKVLGTSEVSAFVTVRALIDVSSSFFGGFHESIATLCSQAMGKHNHKLVGQYVQLSVIFYVVLYLPFILLWWAYMPSVLSWLGFDAETVAIGHGYTRAYLMLELLDGVDESIHGLLDVIDLESYSTLVGCVQELVTFLDILVATLWAKPSLYVIGLVELFVALIFLAINIGTILWRGWFQPYREGMIGSCALYNKFAVKQMLSTASCLSIGYLLTDGEWVILTLFAKVLGPAEVAAWGILGVLWDLIEELTEAVADASEVRCAFLLGSGQPAKAKRSAYKSIFMGVFLSLFITSLVFMAGDDMATWFTNDPALQHILAGLFPLFGIGNITLTVGTICWTLLGAQGRYGLATVVAGVTSWGVTLPLAALFTFPLKINLQGNTAAVVIGYMASGWIHGYFLFRSDWVALSHAVQTANENGEVSPPEWNSSGIHPSTPDTASSAKDDQNEFVLAIPTGGALETLVEGNVEDSFVSECTEGYMTPRKEIV